jgi:hypothetical protein
MQGLVEGCARIETFPPGHLYDSKSGTTQATCPLFCLSVSVCVFSPRIRSPNPLPFNLEEATHTFAFLIRGHSVENG